VFGAGIFSDDDALDVRNDYKYFLADAQSDVLATNAIAEQYGASIDEPGAASGFWLALALTQWTLGRLDARVKTIALRIVDDGLDLQKWVGDPLYSKRAKVLLQARAKIASPQPTTKQMPKPLPVQLPGWESGEIVGVRTADGRLALLHMVDYRRWSHHGVKAPVVSILNWTGREIPDGEELSALTYINWRGIQCGNHLYSLASPKRSPVPPDRFLRLGLFRAVSRDEALGSYGGISVGETLDELLADVLTPYWENPSLPAHHPGFDKPEAALFRRP